ncbi:hypothetical protein BU15DRAFT_79707 [Melanogaster broomeanus]|nr:hypothetical protein BU15DRAFT_79707 [Melanogaster broomeanus]
MGKPSEETAVLVESYMLPDGRTIKVGSDSFEAPECMFQPHLVDTDQPGVAGPFSPPLLRFHLKPSTHLISHLTLLTLRNALPNHPIRPRRRPYGAVPTLGRYTVVQA